MEYALGAKTCCVCRPIHSAPDVHAGYIMSKSHDNIMVSAQHNIRAANRAPTYSYCIL